jgi:hypothetical protein
MRPQSNVSATPVALLLLIREVRRRAIQTKVSQFLHTDAGTFPGIRPRPLPSAFSPLCGFLHGVST